MVLKKRTKNKFKQVLEAKGRYKKLYSPEMLSLYSKSELRKIRKHRLKQLGFFSSLLACSVLVMLGVLFLGNPTDTGVENIPVYVKEQKSVSEQLDTIYGKGKWEYGIYQTKLDAYRVEVALSDGSVVEHFYKVDENGNIFRVEGLH